MLSVIKRKTLLSLNLWFIHLKFCWISDFAFERRVCWYTSSEENCLDSKFMWINGDEENRTPDPLLARQVLSQLSYTPKFLLILCQKQLAVQSYCLRCFFLVWTKITSIHTRIYIWLVLNFIDCVFWASAAYVIRKGACLQLIKFKLLYEFSWKSYFLYDCRVCDTQRSKKTQVSKNSWA